MRNRHEGLTYLCCKVYESLQDRQMKTVIGEWG